MLESAKKLFILKTIQLQLMYEIKRKWIYW